MTIGVQTPTGARHCRLHLQGPGASVPTGDGDYTDAWGDLNPPFVYGSLETATAGNLERFAAATIAAAASHLIRIPFHREMTTHCRIQYDDPFLGRVRTFNVSNVTNPGEDHRELVIACEEMLP